jgi:hypothetical protein
MRGSARGKGRPPLHSRRLLVPLTAVSPAAFNPAARIAGGMRTQSRQSAKLFSCRRNWDSPNPSPAGECAPPPLWFWGEGHTRWRERGWESPNSNVWTYTVVLYKFMYFVYEEDPRHYPFIIPPKMRNLLIEQLFAKQCADKIVAKLSKKFPSINLEWNFFKWCHKTIKNCWIIFITFFRA